MKKLIMNRGTGKTLQLLAHAVKTGGTIVCSHKTIAEELAVVALLEWGKEISMPITYEQFKEILFVKKEELDMDSFLIDDVDYLLKMISPVPIKAISMSLDDLVLMDEKIKRVTLCGSSKFKEQFDQANEKLTLQGKIVIPMGAYGHLMSDEEKKEKFTDEVKAKLDQLHFRKIDLSDSIYVVNVGGYIGESTQKEIEYAKNSGKKVEYLEPLGDFLDDLPS